MCGGGLGDGRGERSGNRGRVGSLLLGERDVNG